MSRAVVDMHSTLPNNLLGHCYTDRDIEVVFDCRIRQAGFSYYPGTSILESAKARALREQLDQARREGRNEIAQALEGQLAQEEIILRLPSFSEDGHSPIIDSLAEEVLRQAFEYRQRYGVARPIKMVLPFKLQGFHWNPCEIYISGDSKLLNIRAFDPQGYGSSPKPVTAVAIKQALTRSCLIKEDAQVLCRDTKSPRVQVGVACGLLTARGLHGLVTRNHNDIGVVDESGENVVENDANGLVWSGDASGLGHVLEGAGQGERVPNNARLRQQDFDLVKRFGDPQQKQDFCKPIDYNLFQNLDDLVNKKSFEIFQAKRTLSEWYEANVTRENKADIDKIIELIGATVGDASFGARMLLFVMGNEAALIERLNGFRGDITSEAIEELVNRGNIKLELSLHRTRENLATLQYLQQQLNDVAPENKRLIKDFLVDPRYIYKQEEENFSPKTIVEQFNRFHTYRNSMEAYNRYTETHRMMIRSGERDWDLTGLEREVRDEHVKRILDNFKHQAARESISSGLLSSQRSGRGSFQPLETRVAPPSRFASASASESAPSRFAPPPRLLPQPPMARQSFSPPQAPSSSSNFQQQPRLESSDPVRRPVFVPAPMRKLSRSPANHFSAAGSFYTPPSSASVASFSSPLDRDTSLFTRNPNPIVENPTARIIPSKNITSTAFINTSRGNKFRTHLDEQSAVQTMLKVVAAAVREINENPERGETKITAEEMLEIIAYSQRHGGFSNVVKDVVDRKTSYKPNENSAPPQLAKWQKLSALIQTLNEEAGIKTGRVKEDSISGSVKDVGLRSSFTFDRLCADAVEKGESVNILSNKIIQLSKGELRDVTGLSGRSKTNYR